MAGQPEGPHLWLKDAGWHIDFCRQAAGPCALYRALQGQGLPVQHDHLRGTCTAAGRPAHPSKPISALQVPQQQVLGHRRRYSAAWSQPPLVCTCTTVATQWLSQQSCQESWPMPSLRLVDAAMPVVRCWQHMASTHLPVSLQQLQLLMQSTCSVCLHAEAMLVALRSQVLPLCSCPGYVKCYQLMVMPAATPQRNVAAMYAPPLQECLHQCKQAMHQKDACTSVASSCCSCSGHGTA